MRTFWLKTCRSFEDQVYSSGFMFVYRRLQAGHPVLEEFRTPRALAAHLQSRVPLSKDKDPLFHALLSAAQGGGPDASAAGSLLFVALVPGLSGVIARTRRHFYSEAECCGQVTLWFFAKVARWSLGNRSGIAVNLCLSTLHGVLEDLRKEWADHERGLEAHRWANALSSAESPEEVLVSDLWKRLSGGDDRYFPDDPELGGLRDLLATEVGLADEEITLLLLKGPCRHSWEAIGIHLHMKPESARKRHQRLCERLKDHPLFDL